MGSTKISLFKKDFKTDFCTLFPNGTYANPEKWKHCCLEHDKKYWMGGTIEEELKADLALKECVTSKGHPLIANIMYFGIRIGHKLPYKLKSNQNMSYHWGWGQSPDKKIYKTNSDI